MDASQTAYGKQTPEANEQTDPAPDTTQARPSPGELVDKVLRYLHMGQGEVGSLFSETVRRNPLPAALLGAGLGWLAIVGPWGRRRNSADQESGDTATPAPQPRRRPRSALFDQPLVLGALGVALGAVVAVTLREPTSGDAGKQADAEPSGAEGEAASAPDADQPPLADVTRRAS